MVCFQKSYAQGFLRAEGKEIVDENGEAFILKGMGLGGWMLQEGYMLQTAEFANAQHQIRERISTLIGEERTQTFYDAWLSNHVTKADIMALKDWGFNSVRLPMHYNLFTLPIQEEPMPGQHTWLDIGFTLTDSLIQWCAEAEMYVILDLHAAPGGQGYDQGISDYDEDLPSLWESTENQDKTVALWRQLAERYKEESWVAGYDLINEVNWDLPGGQSLRNLYGRITDAIRSVDQDHIIFIEGNWFANDFTGLTPPWDENMVYSPHKYWSTNDQASIQWVLDLRNQYNVPLYLGETGENSNVWFRDAIALFEQHNIGWAWWPMKKVESIAGPLSVTKTEGYENLLSYWKGGATAPDSDVAFDILMEMADNLKFENCRFQKDVVDAMFRQQDETETIAFSDNEIPGLIYAVDYDLGPMSLAYNDDHSATYHVSTGNYTAWNNGWTYRNDGVDIEPCEDSFQSNGYNVGWTSPGEWMKYSCQVMNSGIYDINIRVATPIDESSLFFEVDGAAVTEPFPVPVTGDYQEWITMTIPSIILREGKQEIICHIHSGEFNINSFEFIYKGSADELACQMTKGITRNKNMIELQHNKPLHLNSTFNVTDFRVTADGNDVALVDVLLSPNSDRIVQLITASQLRGDQQIRVSYSGNVISGFDNTVLTTYENRFVENTLDPVLSIPGLIEAEDYAIANGIELETCNDLGGGFNIGYLDPGDKIYYEVNVEATAEYDIQYRIASESTAGRLKMTLVDQGGLETEIETLSFPITGGWQTWNTVTSSAYIEEGSYTLVLEVIAAPFNLNWILFDALIVDEPPRLGIQFYPNPITDVLNVIARFTIPHQVSVGLFDASGRQVVFKEFVYTESLETQIDLSSLASGLYILQISLEDGTIENHKIVIE